MSAACEYRGRRAAVVENDALRVTALQEGGHIAEIFDKRSGVNPLWTPPWASIEPSAYSPAQHPEYGDGADARLLAGIMGHNLCVDIFGGPSDAEAAAGLTPHGEASVVLYELSVSGVTMTMAAVLPGAALRVEREIVLVDRTVKIREIVENLAACDRPIGWTQHVTLGPPFLEKGQTEFRASATRSKVFERPFGVADDLVIGAYVWKREDFPWLGIWQENLSRTHTPWNGVTLACGMEFGASPMPESRREMIDRGRLFDVPTFRWIPAKSRVEVVYWAIARDADVVPDVLTSPTSS